MVLGYVLIIFLGRNSFVHCFSSHELHPLGEYSFPQYISWPHLKWTLWNMQFCFLNSFPAYSIRLGTQRLFKVWKRNRLLRNSARLLSTCFYSAPWAKKDLIMIFFFLTERTYEFYIPKVLLLAQR